MAYCENCGSVDIEIVGNRYKCLQCGKVYGFCKVKLEYKGKAECPEPDLDEVDVEEYLE